MQPQDSSKRNAGSVTVVPDQKTVEKLNRLATEKLAEIVRRHSAGEPQLAAYDNGGIAAARELLEKTTTQVTR